MLTHATSHFVLLLCVCTSQLTAETRIDCNDANAYTEHQFIDCYGPDEGRARWASAPIFQRGQTVEAFDRQLGLLVRERGISVGGLGKRAVHVFNLPVTDGII